MSRKPVIAGNWKMFKDRNETRQLCQSLLAAAQRNPDVETVVCPPFTALSAALEVSSGTALGLGAQNVHWEEKGAYTGEISLAMLLDCGCQYVVLGHSERRQLFRETNQMVNLKLTKVLTSPIVPIVCVGETLSERQSGRAREVVLGQLEQGLEGLTARTLSRIIIAYEPIWAIGTGQTATPETAQAVHYMIRNWLGERLSKELPGVVRILYGGSVNPGNVAELMAQDDIDGALVGGASLNAKSFAKIIGFSETVPSGGS